jgi:FkbM family methyltransferase
MKKYVRQQSKIKERLIAKLGRIINSLENQGNEDHTGEANFVKYILSQHKLPVVFDVGANVGDFSALFGGKTYMFEPSPTAYQKLLERYSREPRAIIDAGVSDCDRITVLHSDKKGSGLASLYKRPSISVPMNMQETIRLIRLDTYIAETMNGSVTHIDLLKIDVEGHELHVLKGLGKYLDPKFISYIQFEYGGANIDSHTPLREIYYLLQSKGFIMTKMMKDFLEIRPYSKSIENYTYSNFVAIGEIKK